MSDSLWSHDCSMPGFPVLHHLPEFAQTHVHWFGDSIQPSHPLPSLILLPSIFPSISVFSNEKSSIGILALASVLPMNIQDWFPLGWLCGSPCSPRDSQESWTPQFKTIISSSLTVLYGATITSIHDYWKNHSFDYIELFQESNVSLFFFNV